MGYDSNVFGRKNNVKSDVYAQETATVQLSSDWTRHSVGASAIIDSRQYLSRATSAGRTGTSAASGGTTSIRGTNVDLRYRHYREHLDVYNFDVQSAGISKPVPYDSDEVQVSGSTRFNRLGLTAIGLYRTFRFEDVDLAGGEAVHIEQQLRHRDRRLVGQLRLQSGALRDRHGAVAGHLLREEHLPRPRQLHLGGTARLRVRLRRRLGRTPRDRLSTARLQQPADQGPRRAGLGRSR